MEDVVRFLETKHQDGYRVYNLCAERSYPANKFRNRVGLYPFEDHNVPPLDVLLEFCRDAEAWLRKDPKNVICVHCLAGKVSFFHDFSGTGSPPNIRTIR